MVGTSELMSLPGPQVLTQDAAETPRAAVMEAGPSLELLGVSSYPARSHQETPRRTSGALRRRPPQRQVSNSRGRLPAPARSLPAPASCVPVLSAGCPSVLCHLTTQSAGHSSLLHLSYTVLTFFTWVSSARPTLRSMRKAAPISLPLNLSKYFLVESEAN